MSPENLCLKWMNFENNIVSYLDVLRNENDFVDVTITCGEKNFKAHKVILSACSPYFRGIFQNILESRVDTSPLTIPEINEKGRKKNEKERFIIAQQEKKNPFPVGRLRIFGRKIILERPEGRNGQENPCSHPVIILKNVSSSEMEAIIQYIYTGETFIAKDDLCSFLKTANLLQIIGLVEYHFRSRDQTLWKNGTFIDTSKSAESVRQGRNRRGYSSKSVQNRKKSTDRTGDDSRTVKKPERIYAIKKKIRLSRSEGLVFEEQRQQEAPAEVPTGKETTNEGLCPILSKQLLLPKKRKLSVVDQNRNEFYDNSELSNGSEDAANEGGGGTILRTCLEDKPENGTPETEEETGLPDACVSIKKEAVESVLEPEVDVCVKEEHEFESASEDSLPNGDILLQRLQAFQDGKCDGNSDQSGAEDSILARVSKPEITIFSKKISPRIGNGTPEFSAAGDGENLTLTPNVEIFLRNANNSSENLINKLTKINMFKSKQLKKLKRQPQVSDSIGAGTSGGMCADKEYVSGKNGLGNCDGKTFNIGDLPCPHCRQNYNNLSALKYHVRLMHSDLENKLFCHLCPMTFIEREYFKIHLWEAHKARF